VDNRRQLRVTTLDRTFIVYEEDETRKIDSRRQVDGIVAHLVHSLDAAHMMLTINRLEAEGVPHRAVYRAAMLSSPSPAARTRRKNVPAASEAVYTSPSILR
jgi:DNA-directed RNA polymerase